MTTTINQPANNTARHLTPYEETQLARAKMSKIDRSTLGTEPIEYITGTSDFCGYPITVTPHVLIPRVETEELVQHLVKKLVTEQTSYQNQIHIREVGTGSGALGLVLFLELSSKLPTSLALDLQLSDISIDALHVAKQNMARLIPPQLQQSVSLFKADLLTEERIGANHAAEPLPSRYDLIVANLPYIPTTRIAQLEPSVKDHEPHLALDGGDDGFHLLSKLIQQAATKLNPGGQIWLEVDHTHTLEFLTTHYPKIAQQYVWQSLHDSYGQPRFLVGGLKK